MLARNFQLLGAAGLLAGALASCAPGGDAAENHADHPIVQGRLAVLGRLTLTGALADAREGGVNLRIVEAWSGRVLLQRVYDLGDPLWDRRDSSQALYYAIGPGFEFDARPPVRGPLVLEVIHLPPGVAIEPKPAFERVAVAWEPDGAERDLVLHGAAAVAGAEPATDEPR
ncbi:MAG: hypothetical protein HZA53_01590 [Planctomycetes bacterium]|nr:hypothetical protein [Planctomycetota bacterium]